MKRPSASELSQARRRITRSPRVFGGGLEMRPFPAVPRSASRPVERGRLEVRSSVSAKRRARMLVPITIDELAPSPQDLVMRIGTPHTITEWKALAQRLLTDQPCVFHRNLEISSRYAWMYKHSPAWFKWAGMAAFASHHARLVLYPFRLDTDSGGYADIPRSLGRQRVLLMEDVNTIRSTNNAIFDDIFWVHLAYASTENGIERLRALLGTNPHYQPLLSGFEAIDRGRRVLENPNASATDRRTAEELIWDGNIRLLEHEQRAVVQPNFDRLSCAFARLFSIGSALSFEARGVRQQRAYFSSFYLYSLGRGLPQVLRTHAWPRVTRFDDRWRWIVTAVVPRFRQLDADVLSVDVSLRRILDDARDTASTPCALPPLVQINEASVQPASSDARRRR